MTTDLRVVTAQRARRERADLAGSVGAGVLGAGLGVALANYIGGAGVLLIVVGGALHATGMLDKHRLEKSEGEAPLWWHAVLYWVCWLTLGGVLVYVAARRIA
jgi:hypothetical protein